MSLASQRLHSRRGYFVSRHAQETLWDARTLWLRLTHSLQLVRPSGFVHVARFPAAPFPPGILCVTSCARDSLGCQNTVASIDSLAPARSPFGLRPCRSLPSGSIPAGDTLCHVMRKRLFGMPEHCGFD